MKLSFYFLLLTLTACTCKTMYKKKIELKNGNFVNKKEALEIHNKAKTIFRENFHAFYDLVHKCKNKDYKNIYPDSEKYLKQFKLISSSGQPSDIVKKIIKAGTDGQNFIIKQFYPFKEN